jgi:hypothetical protein
MNRSAILLVVPCALLLTAASTCEGGSPGSATVLPAPLEQPVYESGDLGPIFVPGVSTEARARFTLGPDELPLAVIAEGEYVATSGQNPATAELWIYDSLGDQDPSNDLLVGAQPMSSPFARAALHVDQPGTFTVRIPLGTGCAGKVALAGGTWSARLRINTSSWHGTVLGWKLRVVTLKGAQIRVEPSCFIRD